MKKTILLEETFGNISLRGSSDTGYISLVHPTGLGIINIRFADIDRLSLILKSMKKDLEIYSKGKDE